MRQSDSISKITPALIEAQKKITSAIKGDKNPFFKSKYAGLPSVIDACKSALNDAGIVALQPIQNDVVETVLIHSSGEWMLSETRIICKAQNDPQAYGSAITYARRYGLQSFVLLPAEDDDGEGAMNRTEDEKNEKKAGLTLDDPKQTETISEKAKNHIKVLSTIMHQKDGSMELKDWMKNIGSTYFGAETSAKLNALTTEKLTEGIEKISAKIKEMQ